MVLTNEQRLRGLALGESEADVGFNFAQRALSLEQTHAALVDAGLEGCSIRSLDLKSHNPRFLVDVARGTPLRYGWGIHQLSVVSPGDAMGNRERGGCTAVVRSTAHVEGLNLRRVLCSSVHEQQAGRSREEGQGRECNPNAQAGN